MSNPTIPPRSAWITWGLAAMFTGAVISFVAFDTNTFGLLDTGIDLADGTADDVAAIQAEFTKWRISWFIRMPARILIGIGLWLLLMGIAPRERGARSTIAKIAAWFGLINAPLGVARFLITLGDADFAADPGVAFGIFWAMHLFGTIIASAILIWLTFGTVAPRSATIVLGVFTLFGLALQAAPPIYTGIGIYSAAALVRQRRRNPARARAANEAVGSDIGAVADGSR